MNTHRENHTARATTNHHATGEVSTSLNGNILPADWPDIISSDDEQKAYEALYDKGEDRSKPPSHQHIDRLSYTLRNGNKELRYLAVQHIFGLDNRNHPQFVAIKENFDRQKPQAVLYEGPQGDPTSITEEEAYTRGEKAYIQFLVLEYNKNLQPGERPIVMESCDLQPQDEPEEYRKKGYSNEEIAAGEVLKLMYYEAQGLKNTPGLTDEQRAQRMQELQSKYSTNLLAHVNPEFFSWAPRSDGQQWNADLIKAEIERQTRRPLQVDFDYLKLPRFKQMFNDARAFRDKYIVKKIAEAGKAHDRIMTVMGSGHAIRDKKALEQFYESTADRRIEY